jgi:hypothetical protein
VKNSLDADKDRCTMTVEPGFLAVELERERNGQKVVKRYLVPLANVQSIELA